MRILGVSWSGGVGAVRLNHRLLAVNPPGSRISIPEEERHSDYIGFVHAIFIPEG
jgi:hypothetical protein